VANGLEEALPQSINQRAFRTLQEITGEKPKTVPPDSKPKDEAAVALGRKGSKARAENMTRSEAAKKAVAARWAKAKPRRPVN
jgi:hypothetical protein